MPTIFVHTDYHMPEDCMATIRVTLPTTAGCELQTLFVSEIAGKHLK